MSVGVMWKHAVARTAQRQELKRSVVVAPVEPFASEALDPLLTSLVRQLFCDFSVPERRRIFFAAAGKETDISGICERIGRALAEITGATVGLVDGSPVFAASASAKKRPRGTRTVEFWHSAASQLGEKLWRVPTGLFQSEFDGSSGVARSELPFDYVIFGSTLSDGAAPLFSKACDGAVLVVTATRTRREAALRAQEVLRSWNVELVGAVLDNRTFPIPESIYRLL